MKHIKTVLINQIKDPWYDMFNQLKAHIEETGSYIIPQTKYKLKIWSNSQRQKYKNKELGLQKRKLLDDIGFPIDIKDYYWEINFSNYKKSCSKLNRSFLLKSDDFKQLYGWQCNMINRYRAGKISDSRAIKLQDINFPLEGVNNCHWKHIFNQYKEALIKVNVPYLTKSDDKLYRWQNEQRKFFKQGRLASWKIELLKRIDFCFEDLSSRKFNDVCNEYFKELKRLDKSSLSKSDKKHLYIWQVDVKIAYNKNTLPQKHKKMLLELGFDFSYRRENFWYQSLEYYKMYKKRFKNGKIPRTFKAETCLGAWCHTQKLLFIQGKLAPDRYKKLKQAGFKFY